MKKRNRDPEKFNVAEFPETSDAFTGAEIEQLIISGLYRAFADDREITDQDVLSEIKETIPLSVTCSERIDELRAWAENRARPAS